MPESTAHDEGGWGDLARELGVEAPAPAKLDEEPPPLPASAEVAEDDGFADGLVGDDGDETDGEGEEGAEGEGGEPGQPGTGRKRRRRRRRRSKRGPEGAEAAVVAATVGEEEAGVVSAVPTEADEQQADDEPYADEAEVEDEEQDARLSVAEEDTGSDVLRELIATWNVPAWDDIIGGLYRPDR